MVHISTTVGVRMKKRYSYLPAGRERSPEVQKRFDGVKCLIPRDVLCKSKSVFDELSSLFRCVCDDIEIHFLAKASAVRTSIRKEHQVYAIA